MADMTDENSVVTQRAMRCVRVETETNRAAILPAQEEPRDSFWHQALGGFSLYPFSMRSSCHPPSHDRRRNLLRV
jgi:hypothetical protein